MKRRTFLKSLVAAYCTPIVASLAPMLMRPIGVVREAVKVVDCYWSGAVDTDWKNPANWEGGKLPGNGDNVFICGGEIDVMTGPNPVEEIEFGQFTVLEGTVSCSRGYEPVMIGRRGHE